MKRIALHTARIYNTNAYISTVQLSDHEFETMVLLEDGTDLENITTSSLDEAKRTHNEIMNKWNDKIYEESIDKCLGFANLGQYVKTVVAC